MTKDGYWRILTAAVVAALTFGCGDQQAVVDHGGSLLSEEGRIAFMRATSFDGPDIESDVYTINVDGSGETRLTDSPGLDGFPSWSPDGERIAFASDRGGGNWELYVMDADGSEQRRLTNTPQDESVSAWSPDGEKIAYAIDVIENPSIHVMNADGTNRRRLAEGNWPTWSPDGEKIAYTVYSGEVPYLAVMNADGSEQRRLGEVSLARRLTGTAAAEEQPAWSPDGQKIAFSSMDDGEIYAMKVDSSARTRLTDTPGYDHWPPTWSPDGTRIAFTTEDRKGSEIYVMNSDGSGLTRLTDDPAEDLYPVWRP